VKMFSVINMIRMKGKSAPRHFYKPDTISALTWSTIQSLGSAASGVADERKNSISSSHYQCSSNICSNRERPTRRF